MKKSSLFIIPVIGLFAGAAFAKDNAETFDFASYKAANMNLAQAISLAEQKSGGQAVGADFAAAENGAPAEFEIRIIGSDGKITDYLVNPADKSVTLDTAQNDQNDGQDNEQDGEENDG